MIKYANLLIQASITEYHRFGGLNKQILFFIIIEAEKSKFKVQADLVPGGNSLRGL